jgi:N-sulfoglucosamine sulfohydrolase
MIQEPKKIPVLHRARTRMNAPVHPANRYFVTIAAFVGTIAIAVQNPFVLPCRAGDRPNILFILTEDQGAHLSLLETPGLQTPNMDALARSGVYFRNAFVAYPVCSASKAALYTGLHSHTNGILNNTHNYHKPADQLTAEEINRPLYQTNRVRPEYLTLVEILRANGYYQGVTHKLHVAPVEKFPYDEFLRGSENDLNSFFGRARDKGKPWFLMVNIANSHRPYPNSDKQRIRVKPQDVGIPDYLPDTPVIRKDWAEYLAAIEETDTLTGQALSALKKSSQEENTFVIFMSDHGPTFQHGKMTLYDLGLRVPLSISGPGIPAGEQSDALVSEIDLLPTILELIGRSSSPPLVIPGAEPSGGFPYQLHGVSLCPVLKDPKSAKAHELIFAEISDRGPLPNDGMQERAVFDGRWKLIYREKVATRWRQVNADSRMFKTWGNRTYAETIQVKDQFPEQYRVLAEMDPQELGGAVPELELYDLSNDRDEMHNLVDVRRHAGVRDRLLDALRRWTRETGDRWVTP